MENKQITVDYLKDLYRYHNEKANQATVQFVKDSHLIAKECIFETIELIGKGKKAIWSEKAYKVDNNNDN